MESDQSPGERLAAAYWLYLRGESQDMPRAEDYGMHPVMADAVMSACKACFDQDVADKVKDQIAARQRKMQKP